MQRGANGAVFQLKGAYLPEQLRRQPGMKATSATMPCCRSFCPFGGKDAFRLARNQTRLIAINEGRLVDFFLEHKEGVPAASQAYPAGPGRSRSRGRHRGHQPQPALGGRRTRERSAFDSWSGSLPA